jgi:fumarate reductase flavoprotein subunit
MQDELDRTGVAGGTREFNLGWHDWLDLDSLLTVSRAIAHAALAREDSRGAHYREDFPETGDLERSAYTRTRFANGGFSVEFAPVAFTRVRPGQSLG